MDDTFKTNMNLKLQREQDKKERYENISRERLSKIASKKLQTTMIGSLDSVEKHFGFLWKVEDADSQELILQKEKFKEIYQQIRKEILDNGNTQIKNLLVELTYYDIHWKRYQLSLPVKPRSK